MYSGYYPSSSHESASRMMQIMEMRQHVLYSLRGREEQEAFRIAERDLRDYVIEMRRYDYPNSAQTQLEFRAMNGNRYAYVIRNIDYYAGTASPYPSSSLDYSVPTDLHRVMEVKQVAPKVCKQCGGKEHEEGLWYGMCTKQVEAWWENARQVYWAKKLSIKT